MQGVGLPRRMGLLVTVGVVFWFVAAVTLRFLEPLQPFAGAARVVSYLLTVPVLALSIWVGQRIVGFSRGEAFGAVSVLTMVAVCCDGLAFGFFPGLYGADPAYQLAAAGVVLWGGGVGMVLAYLWSRGAA